MSLPADDEVIGVLGGMGPAATADFYAKLVALTPADRDQDHARVVIWADPTVPDRTRALLGDGPDPSDWLRHGAQVLADAGATVLAVPCNTAHAFLPVIEQHVGLPVIDMVDAVARYLRHELAQARTVGLLATTGTLAVRLYQDRLAVDRLRVLVPDPLAQQQAVMPAIRAIKAGEVSDRTRGLLVGAAADLVERGAEALIAGCTEIPLGLPAEQVAVPVVDPTLVLAGALLRHVGLEPLPAPRGGEGAAAAAVSLTG